MCTLTFPTIEGGGQTQFTMAAQMKFFRIFNKVKEYRYVYDNEVKRGKDE